MLPILNAVYNKALFFVLKLDEHVVVINNEGTSRSNINHWKDRPNGLCKIPCFFFVHKIHPPTAFIYSILLKRNLSLNNDESDSMFYLSTKQDEDQSRSLTQLSRFRLKNSPI